MPKQNRRGRPGGRKMKSMSPSTLFNKFNRRLVSERNTMVIRLTTGPGSYSATAGGVASGYIAVDPTIVSYTELADIKALYSSYRLIAAELEISPETGNTTKRSLWFGSLLNTGLAAPTSYAQVDDNANSLKYANIGNDNTGRTKKIFLGGDVKLGFQEWGTAATDVAGAPGGFYWYGDGFTASVPYALISLRTIFEVRNRV